MKTIIFLSLLILIPSVYSACPADYEAYDGDMGCMFGIGDCSQDSSMYICIDLTNDNRPVHRVDCDNKRHIKLSKKLIKEINRNDEDFTEDTKNLMTRSIQGMIDTCK